jgi:creatinine amidohydrolase/Fe(II)-dependent formamide hydrolase-like protein
VYLEELTWTELRERVAGGTTTILVPVGGTEQNGPAMVLGKHNLRVKILAGRVASGLGNALVAPVLAYVPEGRLDPPTAHMRFPGTITIPERAFESILESAARSFSLHGFKDVVFLGDHGGYLKSIQRITDKLNGEWRTQNVRAHAMPEYYRAFDAEYPKLLKRQGYSDAEIGTHAGLADTSLTLAVVPDAVRADRLHGKAFSAADGVYGQPARSNAQAGQLGAELIVGRTIESIRRETARP